MPDRTQLTVKIDAKIHYLAGLYADECGFTLADFIEMLVGNELVEQTMIREESDSGFNPSTETLERFRKQSGKLWRESLWDDDPAKRLFILATQSENLLSRSERKLWSEYCSHRIQAKGGRLTMSSFKDFHANKTAIKSMKKVVGLREKAIKHFDKLANIQQEISNELNKKGGKNG